MRYLPKKIALITFYILVFSLITPQLLDQIRGNALRLKLYDTILEPANPTKALPYIEGLDFGRIDRQTALLSAIAYYQVQQFNLSEAIFKTKPLVSNTEQVVIYWYGLTLASLGRNNQAAELWHAAKIQGMLIDAAYDAELLGDYSTAFQKYATITKVDPLNEKIWFLEGKALWNWLNNTQKLSPDDRQKLFSQAGSAFSHAYHLEPHNPDYLNWWGYYQYEILGNNSEAQAYLEEAIRRYDPANEWAYYRLGLVYLSTGELDKAILAFDAASEASSGEEIAIQKELAKAHYLNQEYNQSIQILNRANERFPNRADIHYWLAINYLAACQVEDAQDHLEIAKSLDMDGLFQHLQEQYNELYLSESACERSK